MNQTPAKIRKGDVKRERGNRTGFTTGACSAAAARAATLGLLHGNVPGSVVCRLPNGQDQEFTVLDGSVEKATGQARAVIVKDAGDDPDATNGAHLTADVRVVKDRAGEIALKGGAPAELVEAVRAAETARFAAERLAALGLSVDFHRHLATKAIRSLKTCYPGPYRLTVLACDFDGEFIVRVDDRGEENPA